MLINYNINYLLIFIIQTYTYAFFLCQRSR